MQHNPKKKGHNLKKWPQGAALLKRSDPRQKSDTKLVHQNSEKVIVLRSAHRKKGKKKQY